MRFRNAHPAFDGDFEVLPTADNHLHLKWTNGEEVAILRVDLDKMEMGIESSAMAVA